MRIVSCVFLAAGLVSACGGGTTGSNGPGGTGGATAGTNGGTATATTGASLPVAVSTVAGKGPTGEGFIGGDAGSAEFNAPAGLGVDIYGNIYVADSQNNAIRRISTSGDVSTIAGLGFGMNGLVNGNVKSAEFYGPLGVAADSAGNLYVADTGNSAIRKITTSGTVSIFVGQSNGNFVSSGAGAGVNHPSGLAFGSSGTLYVADSDNNAIRMVDSSGNVSTLVGGPHHVGFTDGDAGNAQFQSPFGIAVDGSGNVYFADQLNNAVRKVDMQGNVSTLAGLGPSKYGFVDGPPSTAEFFQPYGLAIDAAGNLYVADQRNNAVRKIDPQGNVSTIAGRGSEKYGFVDGDAGVAEFYYPAGVLVDSSGNIYVSDQNNNAVRKITP